MSLTLFYIVCRWLHFAALMSLAGALSFSVLLAPRRYRPTLGRHLHPTVIAASGLTLLSAVLMLAAQTGLVGEGWQDVLSGELWLAVLQTGFGQAWQWQCLLAAVGCLALVWRRTASGPLLLVLALLQLAGLAFVGHAAMLEGWPGVLQRSNQIVHLTAAAFWAGGLWPVVILMRLARQPTERDEAILTMMRFSRYGHLAVALVVASGAVAALLLLGWPPASFRLYSQLLLLKTLLVAAMVGIALFNRYWLVPRFRRNGADTQRYFVATTLAEIALAALALLSVSLFATLEPA